MVASEIEGTPPPCYAWSPSPRTRGEDWGGSVRGYVLRLTRRVLVPVAAIALAVFAASQLFGPPGATVAAVLSVLWLAWRNDNKLGTWLVFAVLFLVVIGVMLTLFALLMLH